MSAVTISVGGRRARIGSARIEFVVIRRVTSWFLSLMGLRRVRFVVAVKPKPKRVGGLWFGAVGRLRIDLTLR